MSSLLQEMQQSRFVVPLYPNTGCALEHLHLSETMFSIAFVLHLEQQLGFLSSFMPNTAYVPQGHRILTRFFIPGCLHLKQHIASFPSKPKQGVFPQGHFLPFKLTIPSFLHSLQ
jgi:hypothetical protein